MAVGQALLLCTDAFAGWRLDGKVHKITPMGDAAAAHLPHPHRAARGYADARRHEREGTGRRSASPTRRTFVPNVQVGAARSGGGTRQSRAAGLAATTAEASDCSGLPSCLV